MLEPITELHFLCLLGDVVVTYLIAIICMYIQGESKKSVISKNMAITALKSIRKGKS